jgi:hypothetical protein
MKLTLINVVILSIVVAFGILLAVSFVVYPEMGEKILYGKHPPMKDLEHSETIISAVDIEQDETTPTVDVENNEMRIPTENFGYSKIMASGNDKCIEYANSESNGDLNKFVEEFNDCNSQ